MAAEVRKFLGADHARLDELLTQTLSGSSSVDYEAWQAFRHGLLQHIAWEETILMVALRKSGAAKELCDRIRADHALLAALLVPPPRAELVLTARRILAEHNKVEEAMDGLYAQCLEVADDAHWFRLEGDDDGVDLTRRRALRGVLRGLVDRRVGAPGEPMSVDDVLESGWPGERMSPESGARRVYVTINRLRKLGLGDLLLTTGDGYMLAPRVDVVTV